MKVEMIALREFPLGKHSRALIKPGARYEVNASQVAFHEATKRGRRAKPPEPEKTPAAKATPKAGKKGA